MVVLCLGNTTRRRSCPRLALPTRLSFFLLVRQAFASGAGGTSTKMPSLLMLLVGASYCAPPGPGLVSAEMDVAESPAFSHHFPFLGFRPNGDGGLLGHEVVVRSSVSPAGSVSCAGKGLAGRAGPSVPARVVARWRRPAPHSLRLFCRLLKNPSDLG
jgi:hypothetical protein